MLKALVQSVSSQRLNSTAKGSRTLIAHIARGNHRSRQGNEAVPAIARIQRAQCAAHARQRGIQGLALPLLAIGKATLNKMHGRRMEAAKSRRMQDRKS